MARTQRLTSAEKHSLATHISWSEWGERFGFRLFGSNDEHLGHFYLPSGQEFIVSKEARDLVDAAMRDQ